MLKRVISLLFCLNMLVSMLPVWAFATEEIEDSTEEITVPTEIVVKPTEYESVCTGLVDCPVNDHNDGCEKKAANEKKEADKNTAVAVTALIDALPALKEIQAKELEEQAADYDQVQAAYSAYENLTENQKALLPFVEGVIKPYFDYFDTFCGTTQELTGHDYKAVITTPTCTEQGYTTYTCNCGDRYVDDYVDATGHKQEFL